MNVREFTEIIGSEFFTGVPDSQLRTLCDYLTEKYGNDIRHHLIAANEGNATALAAGYYLATGKIPVVYMQNSGIGNIVNPVVSLLHPKVYGIPCIFIVGWRGEPKCSDEPQHVFQGEITERLLQDVGMATFVVRESTSTTELLEKMTEYRRLLKIGKSVVFIIAKKALFTSCNVKYTNKYVLMRESVIEKIVEMAQDDIIVSTTGKASRELFEIRERNGQEHNHDFLTVGSMGHSSSIALAIALQKTENKVWCIDGDGSLLMHMGAMAVIGNTKPNNLVHIIINNEAHETVGGMPTASSTMNMIQVAAGCGYEKCSSAKSMDELVSVLERYKQTPGLSFLEVKASIGAREDLGRPTKLPIDNRIDFMEYINSVY